MFSISCSSAQRYPAAWLTHSSVQSKPPNVRRQEQVRKNPGAMRTPQLSVTARLPTPEVAKPSALIQRAIRHATQKYGDAGDMHQGPVCPQIYLSNRIVSAISTTGARIGR